MTDTSDDDLERRMRRKLFLDGPSNRGHSFSEEEQRMAAKLLGSSEAQRLQNRRDNSRPFKPKKPLVVVEYYEVPGDQYGSGGWRVDVRVDGVVTKSRGGLSRADCLSMVADCERRGATSKAIVTEWMKLNPTTEKAQCSTSRKSFSDRFGDFDPEVDE
jgi:hypothetical protein